ncbi:MAG TPA: divalent-cation tolerance protein CutA [Dissulfurispiraceae bacterium]|nr:divalent-cation tolerance protein CutA [Dissulfurispiraceae bacterium]
MDYLVVYVTAPNEDEAAKIAKILIEERLAGCVNIVRSLRSIYRWQGAIEDESEVLMICKTRRTLFEALEARVKTLHSYSVPEVIALPIVAGSREYLAWLDETTQ